MGSSRRYAPRGPRQPSASVVEPISTATSTIRKSPDVAVPPMGPRPQRKASPSKVPRIASRKNGS